MADEETRNRSSASVSPEGGRLIGRVKHLLKRLHGAGTERDRAGNRRLFFDDYLILLLFYFFNPSIKSLRALQQSTNWESTRQKLGIRRMSLGSLSEAVSVFDPELVRPIIAELAAQAVPLKKTKKRWSTWSTWST